MKTKLSLLLAVILLTPQPAYAKEESFDIISSSTSITYSYLDTAHTKTASKSTSYKNSSGSVMYSVTVKGSFTFNGSSSICKNSEVIVNIYNSHWKEKSKSAIKSENKAIANATLCRYENSTIVSTRKETIKLTCDRNGHLS